MPWARVWGSGFRVQGVRYYNEEPKNMQCNGNWAYLGVQKLFSVPEEPKCSSVAESTLDPL